MFSNLQNKIDLKKIKEDSIEIDSEFAFKEDFDIVNQTLAYFEKKKHITNNVIIKEEVIQYENEDMFTWLDETVKAEQKFIYNEEEVYWSLTEQMVDEFLSTKENAMTSMSDSYGRYHKVKKLLPSIMEEENEELKTELDAYRMVNGDYEQFTSGEYDTEALFDKEVLDKAKHEYLDQIYTTNWLEKQLVDYRKAMNDSLKKGNEFQIDNGLKSLDVNDTEEIKNKIKDLNESVKFLKSRMV